MIEPVFNSEILLAELSKQYTEVGYEEMLATTDYIKTVSIAYTTW